MALSDITLVGSIALRNYPTENIVRNVPTNYNRTALFHSNLPISSISIAYFSSSWFEPRTGTNIVRKYSTDASSYAEIVFPYTFGMQPYEVFAQTIENTLVVIKDTVSNNLSYTLDGNTWIHVSSASTGDMSNLYWATNEYIVKNGILISGLGDLIYANSLYTINSGILTVISGVVGRYGIAMNDNGDLLTIATNYSNLQKHIRSGNSYNAGTNVTLPSGYQASSLKFIRPISSTVAHVAAITTTTNLRHVLSFDFNSNTFTKIANDTHCVNLGYTKTGSQVDYPVTVAVRKTSSYGNSFFPSEWHSNMKTYGSGFINLNDSDYVDYILHSNSATMRADGTYRPSSTRHAVNAECAPFCVVSNSITNFDTYYVYASQGIGTTATGSVWKYNSSTHAVTSVSGTTYGTGSVDNVYKAFYHPLTTTLIGLWKKTTGVQTLHIRKNRGASATLTYGADIIHINATLVYGPSHIAAPTTTTNQLLVVDITNNTSFFQIVDNEIWKALTAASQVHRYYLENATYISVDSIDSGATMLLSVDSGGVFGYALCGDKHEFNNRETLKHIEVVSNLLPILLYGNINSYPTLSFVVNSYDYSNNRMNIVGANKSNLTLQSVILQLPTKVYGSIYQPVAGPTQNSKISMII